MRRALLVLLAACGPKPRTEEPVKHTLGELQATVTVQEKKAAATRPAIELESHEPDFHDELRWPLSGMTHPTLEPRYAIAQELSIGLGWEELCSRGVHNRVSATQRELLSYLRGWCHVAKKDIDNACAQLTPLIGSTHRGLTPAVRIDLANILVQEGAEKAEHWLAKHNIRDTQLLDLLAANFIEVGTQEDAYTINRRAIDSDSQPSMATRCRRLAKRIVITPGAADALGAFEELRAFGSTSKTPDPVCKELFNKIDCSRAYPSRCAAYFVDQNIDPKMVYLIDVMSRWPSGLAHRDHWWELAQEAKQALPVPGAAEIAVSAWEAAVNADLPCEAQFSSSLNNAIDEVLSDRTNEPYKQRLERLSALCPKPPLPTPAGVVASAAPAGGTANAPTTPACDGDKLQALVMANITAKQYETALTNAEAALACQKDPFIVELAFIAACHAWNADKAKQYYKLLGKDAASAYVHICTRNQVKYE